MAHEHDAQFDHHRGRAPLLRPTSHRRALVFLAITFAGYLAVNAFWRYLCTGQWLIVNWPDYWANLIKPLGEMFFFPLDVLTHPWMILVSSLLLAVVLAVPIVLAVLYRLAVAWIFVLVIILLAGAPLLAAAVAGGCLLSATTRLRSDMPFLAVLLGLLPVSLYLYFFGFGLVDTSGVGPLQRWALNAPLLLAVVAAVLAATAVLGMARLTDFRPGVVWPVLTVLLATPLTVFTLQVGADELAYGLIAHNVSSPEGIFELPTAGPKQDLAQQRRQMQANLSQRKADLMAQCSEFLAHFPNSHRCGEVLWIKAQCASIQVETAGDDLRYTSRFAMDEARPLWQVLLDQYPSSPQAALARWRLGELALREGQYSRAQTLLQEALATLKAIELQQADEVENASRIFTAPRSIPDERYFANALLAVDHLLWLIQENDILTDSASAEALSAWLSINPCDVPGDNPLAYSRQLADLAQRYATTQLGDNLALALARLSGDAHALLELSGGRATDATIEANYELGLLALRLADAHVPPSLARKELRRPESYFKTVLEARANPFQGLSTQRLACLKAQPSRDRAALSRPSSTQADSQPAMSR